MATDYSLSDLGSTVIRFPATIVSSDMQQACFTVAIIDDIIIEATEEFTLQLSTDDPQVRLTTESATVLILDNDGQNKNNKLNS